MTRKEVNKTNKMGKKTNKKKIGLILLAIFLIICYALYIFKININDRILLYLFIPIWIFAYIIGSPIYSILPGLIVGWFIGKKYNHKYIGAFVTGIILFPFLSVVITGNFGKIHYVYEVPIEYKVYNEQGVEESNIHLVFSRYTEEYDIYVKRYDREIGLKIEYWGKYNAYIQHALFFRHFDVYAIVGDPYVGENAKRKRYKKWKGYTKFTIDSRSEKVHSVPIEMKDGSIINYKIYTKMGEGKFVRNIRSMRLGY